MLILRVISFVSCYLIKKHLLHIISHVCVQFVSQISSITLMIPLNLSCYENAAIALVCNGCTVANYAIATALRATSTINNTSATRLCLNEQSFFIVCLRLYVPVNIFSVILVRLPGFNQYYM